MRTKIKEYISELDIEINRCEKWCEKYLSLVRKPIDDNMLMPIDYTKMQVRIQTLTEVKNDLQGRLDELV